MMDGRENANDRDRPGSGASLEERLDERGDLQGPLQAILALEASGLGSWVWDTKTDLVTGDRIFAAMFQLDYAARPWPQGATFDVIYPDDVAGVTADIDKAFEGDGNFQSSFRVYARREDGAPDPDARGLRWLDSRGRVTRRGPDGEALEMLGVTRDITPEKQQAERLAMLAGEMDHRVKNAFAVIRSLINLGERLPGDKKGFAETLRGQVQAMADAHAISARLARQSAGTVEVPISALLRSALEPWLGENRPDGLLPARVVLTITDDILLGPTHVSPMAMLIYELAINATKYGALGEDGGRLDVDVRREGEGHALVRWIERAATPTRHARAAGQEDSEGLAPGFGSMLIQHCVSTLGGRIRRRLEPSGLHVDLHIPVDNGAEGMRSGR